ncbi:Diaminobutyrate--2-oxoglutarate aminotransferase [Marinomonas spartinae]|uniref:Diaminobutyrate--2-oxoglutarate aminotransferase n=1 Tax=Marinomonas spartinae TaxID=1792290 RepID=A0A1A8TFC8_9GAMM|nr:diaminobutyrate--2-oxoglutarate transaminase [Marinomonas spartinae]SBS32038.1 Diaminobutyrate--2-oxoglutarate aminotransferase [Marinomonas spartinae]
MSHTKSGKVFEEQRDNEYYLNRQDAFESNVRSYPRKLPFAIAKAKGVWITDVEGKEYLDCLAGAGTLALGHNHDDILEALNAFLISGMPMHTLDLTTPIKDQFSEALLSILPNKGKEYCLQFCGPSGADAVEAALKLAKIATKRNTIISFTGGYHGMTHGALAVTGNNGPKEHVTNLMPGVQFFPFPHNYRCPTGMSGEKGAGILACQFQHFIEDVERGSPLPAAVILEVVQGEGGVNPAPIHWLQQIRKVTQEHGILMIVDEVQSGFGRTGRMFAFEEAGIEPDMIVMSKAIGGGLPLAILGIKKQFDAWHPGAHSGTFRGNQLAMAAGISTLNTLNKPHFLGSVMQRGHWLTGQLQALQSHYPCLAQVRGRGLMIGIEIVDEGLPSDSSGAYVGDGLLAAEIQRQCFKQGLILERGGRNGNVIRLLPPLIITQDECFEVVLRFESALERAIKQMRNA